jgi:hypothetical protein
MRSIFFLLIAFATTISQAHCQPPVAVTDSSESWFDSMIGVENSGIINGPEYKMEFLGASTNPFFEAGEVKGMVRYRHERFYVPILYDVYKDEIIVKHQSASGKSWFIKLDKKLVQEFMISEHLFRNFDRGFHEVLFESDDFLLVARLSKATQVQNGLVNYVQTVQFFLVTVDRWKRLWNGRSFMSMLATKEEKKALKLFTKQNHIKVRRLRNEELVKVAKFVNVLRNKNND